MYIFITGSTDQLLLGLLLGIGTAIIICVIIILIICCFWHPCPLYGRCHRKGEFTFIYASAIWPWTHDVGV